MLLSKKVKIKWNSKIKNHYVNLGYIYTKMGNEFYVNVNHLTNGSNVIVDVECDYCKKHYTKHWYNYIVENQKSNIHKDACNECKHLKTSESVLYQYGVKNVFQLDDVKEKVEQTNIHKYGCKNPFSSEDVKAIIKQNNLMKYGVEYPQQNKNVRFKTERTCIKKYGVKSLLCLKKFHPIGKENRNWKGGVKYHRQERSTFEYRNWRKRVFSRDNYSCKCCGIRSGKKVHVKLNAHHIFNWKTNIKLRYNIDNGVTLCEKCHTLFHSIYGRNNNNESQLTEFLLNYGKKIC